MSGSRGQGRSSRACVARSHDRASREKRRGDVARLLNRIVEEAALRQPGAPAIRCDGETLSYEQLARRANGLARVLVGTGLARGDRVAVWLARGPNVPVSFYGVLAAGGTLVPIDPRSPIEQVVRILRATGATRMVSEPERGEAVSRALVECADVSHVIGLGQDAGVPVRCVPWSTVLEEACDQPPDVPVIELDGAYILHTSGSTGIPKLILHTHYSAMSFVDWAAAEYSLTSDDRLTNHSSHHTCFATFDYYAAARAGATTVILTPAVLMMPGSLSVLLERERITVWYSVPAALVQLSLRGDLEARDLRSIRWVLFAGETFPGRTPAEDPPAASRRPLQPRLRVDRGQRLHVLPPARDGRSRWSAAHRPRVLYGAHPRRRRRSCSRCPTEKSAICSSAARR